MLGIFLCAFAFADPQFTELKQGEVAPFDGRLLNDEAIIKISVEDKFKAQQCDLQIDYAKQKQKALLDLEAEKARIDMEAQVKILEEKVSLRDERIKSLEKLSKPKGQLFYATTGFLVGSAATIGILYAVY